MKHPTIKDVALEAGVSISTVSRVINNTPVDEAMAVRVRSAVIKLNYQPDRGAQRLRTNEKNIIGLIVSDIENPFFTSLVRGVEDIAHSQGMSIVLCNTDENSAKQTEYLNVMLQERASGLIIAPASGQTFLEIQKHLTPHIPIIFLDRDISSGQADSVTVDNEGGIHEAIFHLNQIGCTRIAMINGDIGIKSFYDRFQGYRKAHFDLGLELNEDYVTHIIPRIEPGYAAAQKMLNKHPEIDALIAGNNLIALGVLRALRERGLPIPGTIALVAFDDMPWSGELCPPLTSIAQPTYEIGQEAMRLLLRRIENPEAHYISLVLRTRLIIRESTQL